MGFIRWSLVGGLVLLGAVATAGDVIVDIDEISPGDGMTSYFVQVSIVNEEEWNKRRRVQQELRQSEVDWAQAVGVLHGTPAGPVRKELEAKVDEAIEAWDRAHEQLEPFRDLRPMQAKTPWLYVPRRVAIRFDDELLARRAWLVNPFDSAIVHLKVFRARWLRRPALVGEIEAPLQFVEGYGFRFSTEAGGFAVAGRVHVASAGCHSQIAAAAVGK